MNIPLISFAGRKLPYRGALAVGLLFIGLWACRGTPRNRPLTAPTGEPELVEAARGGTKLAMAA